MWNIEDGDKSSEEPSTNKTNIRTTRRSARCVLTSMHCDSWRNDIAQRETFSRDQSSMKCSS